MDGVRDAFSKLGDGTVGSRVFRASARVSLYGDGVGMAEALAAAYDDAAAPARDWRSRRA